MNNFKESIKVKRDTSGKIVMTEELKKILINLIKGELTKKEVLEITGIGDKGTIEIKIQELVSLNPELKSLYNEYISRKNTNFNGYNFRAEAIDMLRHDYSQSEMVIKLEGVISRRNFSKKIKNLENENLDNILGQLLREHADRKMKRKNMTTEGLIKINLQLDEYENNYPVGTAMYEKRNPLEVRLENYKKVLDTVKLLMQDGLSLKEICEKGIITEGTYRKYKMEAENLTKILDSKVEENIDTPPPGGDDR